MKIKFIALKAKFALFFLKSSKALIIIAVMFVVARIFASVASFVFGSISFGDPDMSYFGFVAPLIFSCLCLLIARALDKDIVDISGH